MKCRTALLALVAFAIHSRATATTVIPPTFEQLVLDAERVIVAEVVDVQSMRVTNAGVQTIVTEVTLKVDRGLKGSTSLRTILQFLGGTVGDETLAVSGMPRFRIGDRDVLFINERGRPISPLVGFMHGRFRLTKDPSTALEHVSQFDFRPFSSISELGVGRETASLVPRASMALADFEATIAATVQRQAARH